MILTLVCIIILWNLMYGRSKHKFLVRILVSNVLIQESLNIILCLIWSNDSFLFGHYGCVASCVLYIRWTYKYWIPGWHEYTISREEQKILRLIIWPTKHLTKQNDRKHVSMYVSITHSVECLGPSWPTRQLLYLTTRQLTSCFPHKGCLWIWAGGSRSIFI